MTDEIKILSIDEIIAAQDIETETVPVPEWGGAVRIRSLTKAAQGRVRTKAMRNGELDEDLLQMHMLLEGMIEPKIEPRHFGPLRAKNAGVVDRILKALGRLSGVTDLAEMSKEAVDEAESSFPEES